MKKILILLALVSGSAFAYDDDPTALFSSAYNKTNQTVVNWIAVDDVTAVCDRERKSKGQNGFGYAVKACSFWDNDFKTCTIITKKNTNMHTLGHEMRHCFQGNWHGD
jgi:hypothetical protein